MNGQHDQHLTEAIDEIRRFLPRLIDATKDLADQLYSSPNQHTWEELGEVVQAIDDLYKSLRSLEGQIEENSFFLPASTSDLSAFSSQLEVQFGVMNRSMDEENYVGAGDAFKHELVPLFERLSQMLGEEESVQSARFRDNLAYLEERFPFVFASVSQAAMSTSYRVCYAANGSANLNVQVNDGHSVHYYSEYDPQFEASKWSETVANDIGDKNNVILYGMGFGYHLAALASRKQGCHYYIFEPDMNVFLSALHVVDLGSLFSGLQVRGLAIGNDKNTINQFFYRFLRVMKGETATLALPVYDRLDLEARNSFNQIAKEAVLNYAYSQSLLQNAGLDWVRNIFYNLAVNLSTPSLNGLQGQLKGYPAIIVGAGPSLEEDIEVLKRMKHHAFIIAAGTSIQSLMHYGVEPHLIVTIDGGMPNYHAFSHLKLDDIPILYTPQVQHHIVENRTKNTIHSFLANDMITQVLMAVTQDEAVFASTHSVTGTAIQAAIFMGCEHIVFAGQDLSYPTEVVYASGAKHVDPGYAARIRQSADIQVDNVQGGKNQTTESMLLTLRDIEDLLSKHSNVRFTNTSSLGAQIQHAGFMPLNQIEEKLQANKLETTFFKELMQQHLFSYPELRINQSIDRINEMLGMLKLTKQRLDRIQKSLTKLSELSRSNPLKCLNLMVGIEEEWEPVVKSIVFHTLFMFGLKAEINAFDRHVSDIAEEKNTIRKAKLFKQVLEPLVVAMQGKIPVFEQIIAEAARRIDSRLERTGSGVTQ